MREAADEILSPDISRVDAQTARRDVHQALHHVGCFGSPRTPVGIDRRSVRVDGVDLRVDGRNVVLTRKQGRIEVGWHARREGRHVGAEIGDRLYPQSDDLVTAVERHLGVGDVVAAVSVGEKTLPAVGGPFHRYAESPSRPQAYGLLGIDEDLRPEPAAHIGRHDAKLVLGRDPDECRQNEARDVGIL